MKIFRPSFWLVAVFYLAVSLPLIATLTGYELPIRLNENRKYAGWPTFSSDKGLNEGAMTWMRGVDDYVDDHFGLRNLLIFANGRARVQIFGEAVSDRAVTGPGNWWFLLEKNLSAFDKACGIEGISDAQMSEIAETMTQTSVHAKSLGLRVAYIDIPRKEVIYPERLPSYLKPHCSGDLTGQAEVFEKYLDQNNARPADYAYLRNDFMQARDKAVYTRARFHWPAEGVGAMIAVKESMKLLDLPFDDGYSITSGSSPSDMPHLFAGLMNAETVNVYKGSAPFQSCKMKDCFAYVGEILSGAKNTFRYTSSVNDRRLLLLTDSFGDGIASLYPQQFGDVLHVEVNWLSSRELRARLYDRLLEEFDPTDVIFLFQTGNLTNTPVKYSLLDSSAPIAPRPPSTTPQAVLDDQTADHSSDATGVIMDLSFTRPGNLVRGGAAAIPHRLIGSNHDDILIGDGRKNTIVTNAGDDVVQAGAEADYIILREGTKTVTGGQGRDAFVPEPSRMLVDILDFEIEDDNLTLVRMKLTQAPQGTRKSDDLIYVMGDVTIRLVGFFDRHSDADVARIDVRLQ